MEFKTNEAPPAGCSWIYIIKFYTKITHQLFAVYVGITESPIYGRLGSHCSSSYLGSSEKKNQPSHKLIRMCGKERMSIEPWGIVPNYMAHTIETWLIQTYKNICVNVTQRKTVLAINPIPSLIYCVNPDSHDVEAVYTSVEEIINSKGYDIIDINNAIESNGVLGVGNRLWILSKYYEAPENDQNIYYSAESKENPDFHEQMLREIRSSQL